MKSLKIPLMCALVVIIILASFHSGPEVQVAKKGLTYKVTDDFFDMCTDCKQGDTMLVIVGESGRLYPFTKATAEDINRLSKQPKLQFVPDDGTGMYLAVITKK